MEELESRRVLSDFSLGVLAGRTVHTGEHVEVDDANNYSFSLSVPARVQCQLHTKPVLIPILSVIFPYVPDVDIVLREQGSTDVLASATTHAGILTTDDDPIANEQLNVVLPAGDYVLSVVRIDDPVTLGADPVDAVIDFAVAADAAPGSRVPTSGTLVGFKADVSRDFGLLTESPGVDSATDFVGLLDGKLVGTVADLKDVYSFDVPKDGRVTINLGGLASDPLASAADAQPDINVELFRDSDQDGLFEPGESLKARELLTFTQVFSFDGTLSKGRYGLVITTPSQNDSGKPPAASNYNLSINYDVPDLAGDTLATVRRSAPLGFLPW